MVDFINLTIDKNDIIYDGKVKMTYGGQGIIRIKDNVTENFPLQIQTFML